MLAGPATAPGPAKIYLAFDFGTARIGVALGNSLSCSARPLEVIQGAANQTRFARIAALITAWQPHTLLVGRPLYPDGNAHAMTVRAEKFARQLAGRFHLPVEAVDERYTSVAVENSSNRSQHLDAHAASLLIEQYFHEKRHLA